jgi:retron-type reverse transcriptase
MLETNSAQFQSCSFTIPLGTQAHDFARKCRQAVCNTEKDPDKVKRVYLNNLAVYAVDFYLKFLGFETDLKQSNSRDKLMLQFLTEADLPVTNIGRFECIPVEENDEYGEISPDVCFERIGYIFVKLDASRREAVILGFIKIHKAKVDLNQLQSVDDLIDYLTNLEEEVTARNTF